MLAACLYSLVSLAATAADSDTDDAADAWAP